MKIGPNIRLREDGRYEARYFKYVTPAGNPQYGSVYGKTAEEADQKRNEKIRALQAEGKKPRVSTERAIYVRRAKTPGALDEAMTKKIEAVFSSDSDSAVFGFSLCLHMGISFAELCALKYTSFNIEDGTLTVENAMSTQYKSKGIVLECPKRVIPIPDVVRKDYKKATRNAEHYVLTDTDIMIESVLAANRLFRRILENNDEFKDIIPDNLQMTFIRRALESGLSESTIEAATGFPANKIDRRFKQYIVANVETIHYISYKYMERKEPSNEMKLLILGAGSHGHAVYEIAAKLGVFQKIRFLDDYITSPEIIGRCNELSRFTEEYNCCFVAVGDNHKRKAFAEQAIALHYMMPRIISPDASIAGNDVEIGIGTVVFPQSTINRGSRIGRFNIIASNSMVGFDASTGDFVHCDSGSILTRKATVNDLITVESGEIIKT